MTEQAQHGGRTDRQLVDGLLEELEEDLGEFDAVSCSLRLVLATGARDDLLNATRESLQSLLEACAEMESFILGLIAT